MELDTVGPSFGVVDFAFVPHNNWPSDELVDPIQRMGRGHAKNKKIIKKKKSKKIFI